MLASLVFGGYEAFFKLPSSCVRLLLSVMELPAAAEHERSQTPLSPVPLHPLITHSQTTLCHNAIKQDESPAWKVNTNLSIAALSPGTEKEWDHKYNPLFRSLSLGRSRQGIDQTVALKGFNWPSLY